MTYDDVLNGVEASRRAGWAHYYCALESLETVLNAAVPLLWCEANEVASPESRRELARAVTAALRAHQRPLSDSFNRANEAAALMVWPLVEGEIVYPDGRPVVDGADGSADANS